MSENREKEEINKKIEETDFKELIKICEILIDGLHRSTFISPYYQNLYYRKIQKIKKKYD